MFAPALCAISALWLAACSSGGGGSSNPPANNPPTANAGSNQTVDSGSTVTLNGSGTDSDGSVASYAWTQTGGTPTVTLSSSTVAQPTFAAPTVAAATTLTFSLVVRDNRGANSTASSVSISVSPPAAGVISGRVRFTAHPGLHRSQRRARRAELRQPTIAARARHPGAGRGRRQSARCTGHGHDRRQRQFFDDRRRQHQRQAHRRGADAARCRPAAAALELQRQGRRRRRCRRSGGLHVHRWQHFQFQCRRGPQYRHPLGHQQYGLGERHARFGALRHSRYGLPGRAAGARCCTDD